MPNQPAKDTTGIFVRVRNDTKVAIQADVDRLNEINPKANITLSSWIRDAIDRELVRSKRQAKK